MPKSFKNSFVDPSLSHDVHFSINKDQNKLEDLVLNCAVHPNVVAIKWQYQNLFQLSVSKLAVRKKLFLLVMGKIRGKLHKLMIFMYRLQ